MTDPIKNQTFLGPPPPAGRWERRVCLAGAFLVTAWFAVICAIHWVPAHSGVDQNGYLVGGKLLAEHGTDKYTPINPRTGRVDPFQFVGHMWVGVDFGLPNERYYPKYPAGLPLLVAAARLIGGQRHGVWLAYAISPVCMTIGLLLSYWLIEMFAGPFLALLGMVMVASSPVTLGLATNPNSHASACFFVVAGMLALCIWTRRGGLALALLAGFLLGYSISIRYTEGLMILPLAIAALFATRWRDSRKRAEAWALLLGWLIPTVLLATYNLYSIHSLTGYDPTNESTGFTWAFFQDNWETMVRQLDNHGLPLIFPLGLAGMILMFWWNWRAALFMASWIVPSLLIYTAYYWAPDSAGIAFLRFFLSILPALVLCAMALLARMAGLGDPAGQAVPAWRRRGVPVMAGAIIALATIVNAQPSIITLQADYVYRLDIKSQTDQVLAKVPEGSTLFCRNEGLLHTVQFAGDYCLYDNEVFDRRAVDRLSDPDVDSPQPYQSMRRLELFKLLKGYDQRRLNDLQEKLITDALDQGRCVYMIFQVWTPPNLKKMKTPWTAKEPIVAAIQLPPALFATKVVATWSDPLCANLPPVKGVPRAHRPLIPLPRYDARNSQWQIVQVTKRTDDCKPDLQLSGLAP